MGCHCLCESVTLCPGQGGDESTEPGGGLMASLLLHLVPSGPQVCFGSKVLGQPWQWVSDARHQHWALLAWSRGDPGWQGQRVLMGAGQQLAGPPHALARDQAADSRSVPALPGAPILLWMRAVVCRMGRLSLLQGGGGAVLPSSRCIPPSPLGQWEGAFPARLGIAAVAPSQPLANPSRAVPWPRGFAGKSLHPLLGETSCIKL